MKKPKTAVWSKRTLYLLCFLALSEIDLLRMTQNGDRWSLATNCSGILCMLLIASAYPMKIFLTKFSYVWSGICACVIAGACFLPNELPVFGMYKWTFIAALLNVWWIVLFWWALLWRRAREHRLFSWVNSLGVLWMILTFFMVFNASGRVWPLWFFSMFVLFYATDYSCKEAKEMADAMLDGTILAFFLFQIYAYGFRPYDEVRYRGAYFNCNMNALHYLVVYVAVLMKLHLLETRKVNRFWKLCYLVLAAGLLGFLFMTMGRTSWAAAFVITLLYGVLVIRGKWKMKWSGILGRGAALGLLAVALFPVVFATVRWLPTILHHPIWYYNEYSPEKVHSFDPPNSEKYVDLDEFLDTAFYRIRLVKNLFGKSSGGYFVLHARAAEADGLLQSAQTAQEGMAAGQDEAMDIRKQIYRYCLHHLNLFGRTQAEGVYLENGEMKELSHAHNAWIHIAYFHGIPAGICFLALTIAMLFYSLRMLLRENSAYAIIPFFICVTAILYGLFEMDYEPGQYLMFLVFFVQHPRLFSGEKTNDTTQA